MERFYTAAACALVLLSVVAYTALIRSLKVKDCDCNQGRLPCGKPCGQPRNELGECEPSSAFLMGAFGLFMLCAYVLYMVFSK